MFLVDYNKLDLRRNSTFSQNSGKTKRIVLQGNDYVTGIPDEAKNKVAGISLNTEHGYFTLNSDDFSTGTLAVGATGCGKTTLFFNLLDRIIPFMTSKDVMLIFDSKGDYKNRYYQYNNPNHIVISLSEKDKDIAKSWSVFGELIDSNNRFGPDTELIAGEISKALFKEMESSTQPFFHLSSAQIFEKLLSTFVRDAARTGDLSKLKNEELYKFMSSMSNQDLLELTGKYNDYKFLQNYVGDGSSTQALGVYGFLSAMLSRNFVSSFRNKQKAGDFSIRRLIREKGGKVIFLEYDINYSETLSSIYSLFYDLAIKEALSGKDTNSNTYFICDEMNLIPYVTKFEELLNFGRSKGCKTLIGLQSISQLKKNYGEDEADAILAGFLTAICFNSVDPATRKYIKERFGETFEIYNFGGINITREGYTVSDVDIHNLKVGEAFIDMKGVPPFKTRFIKGA